MSIWNSELGPSGLLVGHRAIQPGDEAALRPSEYRRDSSLSVQRRSGAARIVARDLLARWDLADRTIPRSESGAPQWPAGIVGSLSHDDAMAVAAVGSASRFAGVGIDIEVQAPLPAELVGRVNNPGEPASMVTFTVKEAVYKTLNPLDGVFLDFADVALNFATMSAMTASGCHIRFAVTVGRYAVALAWVPKTGS